LKLVWSRFAWSDRDEEQMHVVRHQAPGPHLHIGSTAVRAQKIPIQRIVAVIEEGSRAAIAALGDVVRVTGDDDAGETGHAT
jgi:hypothetical protein